MRKEKEKKNAFLLYQTLEWGLEEFVWILIFVKGGRECFKSGTNAPYGKGLSQSTWRGRHRHRPKLS